MSEVPSNTGPRVAEEHLGRDLGLQETSGPWAVLRKVWKRGGRESLMGLTVGQDHVVPSTWVPPGPDRLRRFGQLVTVSPS